MKLKNILITTASCVLTAAIAVGGTLAYLQNTDSDVNVMTTGSVYIAQHEYQRVVDANGNFVTDTIDDQTSYVLEDFEQGKALLPAAELDANGNSYNYGAGDWDTTTVRMSQKGSYGGMQVFTSENAVDKFVTVENTGKSAAFIRTLVAIECGSTNGALVGSSYHKTWAKNSIGIITINNNNYYLTEYVYAGAQLSDGSWRHENGVLPAGDTSYPNLSQVYIKSEATNEDMVALDGNNNGTLDILVLSQAVQAAGFADAKTALDTAFGKTADKAAEWFGGVMKEFTTDEWDGTADTSWYNDTDTEFVITTAEQLAGLAKLVDGGNTFEGKTINLGKNLDLDGKVFEPIGSYRKNLEFKGTFDGQEHTIFNMSQNTWALNNGYYYGDLGLGLFGKVRDAEIKNLVIDGTGISGESGMCGTVAAAAYGNCTFENITVKNTQVNDYQYYAGGIVGWASGNHVYKNINVDESTVIGSQWGDFGNCSGGIIGGCASGADILMEDCIVACRIDAVNDVVSAYQWYCYRNCGMLIGDTNNTATDEAVTNATAPNLTCENVTVIYGDWANYTYCEFAGTGYPYVRVQAGVSVDAYSNVRYGHPTDANGNKVVDDNHIHNEGEDHHMLIVFDQLYGGSAEHRYCTYGTASHEGVTVIYNNK